MTFVTSQKGKRILLISFLGLAVIAILIAVMLSRNQEGYRTIKISEVFGRVGVVNQGIEYEAYPGMIVKEGYAIVTTSDSYVRMVLDGDKYIKLESGSRVTFETLGVLGSGKTTINLERGTITNEIVHPLGEDENYIINTPNAVLAVRGTFFKVSLKVVDDGDTTTDVHTYAGAVASKRIMPDGSIVDEEVFVDSGYMTTVKMSNEETIYVVESTDSEREHTTPIVKEMISDEDLIDIYFAAENGHEMFIPKEELEEEIKGREIDIKEHTSVYKKAEILEKENVITSPDDGEPLVREEETENVVQGPSSPSDGGHKHKQTEIIVEATCTTDGKIIISCSTCGDLFSEKVIVAKGHTAGTTIITKNPTCTQEGTKVTRCVECGEELSQEVIPQTEHIHEVDGGTAGTHIKCADCGTILSTAHRYTDTIIMEADCFDVGMISHVCTCGYSYTEEIPALGHTEGNPTVTVEASCTTEGTRTTTCTVCGDVTAEETIPATGHTEENGAVADAHTKCSTCGEVLSTTHSYTDTVTQEATCTDTGSMKHTCTCGYSYTEEIPALGHTEGSPTVTVEASCTTEGTRTTTCTVCGDVTAEETIPATGHTEENGAVADAHTKCSTCGEVLSTTHSYTDTVTQEATCTDTGSMKHTCTCGYSYTEEIPALGHTEGTPSVITPATCDTDGQAEVYCDECGIFLQYETLPATGHTKSDENASQTTCSTCGETLIDFNSTNFPDTGFYNSLKNDGVDENSDGILTGTELSKVHTIDYENVGIADATGLEHFTALQYLNLYDNAVSNVPCENLTALTYINLSNTSITSFDATKYPNLTSLYLSGTQISSLDLSNNPNLTTLQLTDCSNLSALDLSNNTALQTAELQFSGLTSFTLDGNTSITSLNLRCNALETISVTNCTSLTTLTLPNEHSCVVQSIDITGCTSLTSVDLNYVASTLQTFIADSSGLSGELEFTSFQALETVSVNNCASLIGLHIGYSSTLTTLDASNSGLAYVNLNGCDNITTLNVSNNRYIVETQNLYVDMSGVRYFYGDCVVQDSLSNGTFSDTVFNFYDSSDGSGITEITYTYDMGNGITAEFTVEIVSY